MKFFIICVLAVLAVAVNGQLSAFLDSDSLASRQTLAKKNLLEPENLKNAYYDARLLEVTKASNGINCDCGKLGKLVKSKESTTLDVYYGLKAASLCDCKVKPLRSIEDTIEEDIISDDINKFGTAALAAKIMKVNINPSDSDIIGRVKSLMQPSGLFRSARGKLGSSNIPNTKLALTILSEYSNNNNNNNNNDNDNNDVSEIATTVGKLLTDPENEKVSDPTLISYLYILTGKKPNMEGKGASTASRIFAITESLLALRHTNNNIQYSNIVESLVIMMSYKARPVYIGTGAGISTSTSTSTSTISNNMNFEYNQDIDSKIFIKDAFGKNINDVDIEVISMKKETVSVSGNSNTNKSYYKGTLKNGMIKFNKKQIINELQLLPGRYKMSLSTMLPDRTKPILTNININIQAKLKLIDINIGVTNTPQSSSIDLKTIEIENSYKDDIASSTNTKSEYIHIDYTVMTPKKINPKFHKPHQCFVKFTHKKTGLSSYFIGKNKATYNKNGSSGVVYSIIINLKKEMENTFLYNSGDYSISILVADTIYMNAINYNIGNIILNFNNKDKDPKEDALYIKSLLHTSDTTLKPLNEITHKMRSPPKSAPYFMSAIFTIFAALPCILLLYYIIIILKPNLKYLTYSYLTICYCFLTGSICLLYCLYWFMLPGFLFYDTIKYLLITFPILHVVSRYAVVDIVDCAKEVNAVPATVTATATTAALKKED